MHTEKHQERICKEWYEYEKNGLPDPPSVVFLRAHSLSALFFRMQAVDLEFEDQDEDEDRDANVGSSLPNGAATRDVQVRLEKWAGEMDELRRDVR